CTPSWPCTPSWRCTPSWPCTCTPSWPCTPAWPCSPSWPCTPSWPCFPQVSLCDVSRRRSASSQQKQNRRFRPNRGRTRSGPDLLLHCL
uniref:Uncharacterized protein n=1 Tax=Poecilia mexicana TaxID=48701 RepID=A0A3B3Z0D2_9TELE